MIANRPACRNRSLPRRTVTAKLLANALGRRLECHDRPAVREIVRKAAARGYRWSDLIQGIAESPPFSWRNK